MKGGSARGGFTIVETMIVLAVTGLLFLVAVLAVSGKQNPTEFHQAVNDIQSQLQQIIGQVSSGDYETSGNLQCIPGTHPIISSVGSQEGSNTGCILLGKVVQFGESGNPQNYIVYTIAGLRENSATGKLCTDLSCAVPLAIAPGSMPTNSTFPDASATSFLENGLTVVCMRYFNSTPGSPVCSPSGGGQPIGAVGFITTLGQYGSDNQLQSGSLQIQLVPVDNTVLGMVKTNAVDAIDSQSNGLAGSVPNPSNGVLICFASGTTNQSALVTIGGSGGSNVDSVTTAISSGKQC